MKKIAEWLDFERPTKKDLEFLRKKFGFHEVILMAGDGSKQMAREIREEIA